MVMRLLISFAMLGTVREKRHTDKARLLSHIFPPTQTYSDLSHNESRHTELRFASIMCGKSETRFEPIGWPATSSFRNNPSLLDARLKQGRLSRQSVGADLCQFDIFYFARIEHYPLARQVPQWGLQKPAHLLYLRCADSSYRLC